jgi:two-component system cell cycle response regulator DivK
MPVRILYIDDNILNMHLIRKMFRGKDYKVIEAPTGQAGIMLAAREQPDLILLEINLPDIDGCEVARRIKSGYLTRHIPIVALTLDTSYQRRRYCLAAGCEGYLNKPVSRVALLRTIQQFLPASLGSQ